MIPNSSRSNSNIQLGWAASFAYRFFKTPQWFLMVLAGLGVISCVVSGDGELLSMTVLWKRHTKKIHVRQPWHSSQGTGFALWNSRRSYELFNLKYTGNQYRLLSCLLKWLALTVTVDSATIEALKCNIGNNLELEKLSKLCIQYMAAAQDGIKRGDKRLTVGFK